ncbi:MAG: hypothetical protein GC191_17760 [Azospirillum sp.]|nr:hypothetical protein [Azospirillum sp.]
MAPLPPPICRAADVARSLQPATDAGIAAKRALSVTNATGWLGRAGFLASAFAVASISGVTLGLLAPPKPPAGAEAASPAELTEALRRTADPAAPAMTATLVLPVGWPSASPAVAAALPVPVPETLPAAPPPSPIPPSTAVAALAEPTPRPEPLRVVAPPGPVAAAPAVQAPEPQPESPIEVTPPRPVVQEEPPQVPPGGVSLFATAAAATIPVEQPSPPVPTPRVPTPRVTTPPVTTSSVLTSSALVSPRSAPASAEPELLTTEPSSPVLPVVAMAPPPLASTPVCDTEVAALSIMAAAAPPPRLRERSAGAAAHQGRPRRFAVQVGSFLVEDNAVAVSRRLAAKGFQPRRYPWTDPMGTVWTVVRVGRHRAKATARVEADQVRAAIGLATMVLPSK